MHQHDNNTPMIINHSVTPSNRLSPDSSTLKLFQINARSVVNKINQIQNFVYSNSVDILGVTETWLTDSIYDQEILPTNFTIYHKDRDSRGGGVMIAVRNNIHSELTPLDCNLEVYH